EIFGSTRSVMAGSFFPPRRGGSVGGGYRPDGRCHVQNNWHRPNMDRVTGHPITLIPLFPREKAEIIDNWDTLGMRGTGSHDVNVDDLFVPAERTAPFKPPERRSPAYSGPCHRLTAWPSVASNAIPALGIAQAAIDEFAELATKK